MKVRITVFLFLLPLMAIAQFKSHYEVNGVNYLAVKNNPNHVTYVQQNHFDNELAADSLYIDVMTESEWDEYSKKLVDTEGAKFQNGIYQTNTGCQVFVSDARDKYTGNLLIVRLFGSVESIPEEI